MGGGVVAAGGGVLVVVGGGPAGGGVVPEPGEPWPTMALPISSTATHSDVDGHDTARRGVGVSTGVDSQVAAPPLGLLDAWIPPPKSVATHSDVPTHDTSESANPPAIAAAFHAAAP